MFGKMFSYYNRFGFGLLIVRVFCKLLFIKGEVEKYKEILWKKVKEQYGLEIAFGPFKGMRLSPSAWWSSKNMTPQVLGLYETNVVSLLEKYSEKFSNFIDIGAADGYYAVGSVFNGMYRKSHAFEINELGRKIICDTAKLNNCADRVTVHQQATAHKIQDIIKKDGNALVIIDIEGGEFDLLSDETLRVLSQCVVICELHPFKFRDGEEKLAALLARCRVNFDIQFSSRAIFELPSTDIFDGLPDDARLLAFSEGREAAMRWLILVPKTGNLINK